MFVVDIAAALVIATILVAIFAMAGRLGPWTGFLWFFLVIFLASWAGGMYARPFGPALFGIYWAPFLFFGVLVALILAAASPYRPIRRKFYPAETEEGAEAEMAAAMALNVFFWVLIGFLLVSLFASYAL